MDTHDREGLFWPRVLWIAGWGLLATMIFHVGALAVSGGPVTGPVSLRKPITFAETGWLTAWSVALIIPLLGLKSWKRRLVGTSVLLFTVGETAIMAIQAWRGVPSHYNFTTPFDAALMRGGAAGLAVFFLAGMVVLLFAALRTRDLSPSVRLGLLGGVAVVLAGSLIGFVMISNMSGVFQGRFGSAFTRPQVGYLGPPPSVVGPEHLLLRLHTAGGDLVLLHAIGVHGLPLLALPAILLGRSGLSERRRFRLVGAVTGGIGLTMIVLATQSFRARPFAEMAGVQLGLLVLAAIGLLAAYLSIINEIIRSGALRLAARTIGDPLADRKTSNANPRCVREGARSLVTPFHIDDGP
jgi:hypothetical protein